MSVVPKANASPAFELKSAALTLIALVLKTSDLALFGAEFGSRFAGAPDLFDHDPVAIDLSNVRADDRPIDFPVLIELLESFKLKPIAVRGGSEAQMEAAYAAGLIDAPEGLPPVRSRDDGAPVLSEVVAKAEADAEAEPEEGAPAEAEPEAAAPAPATRTRTMVVDRPLRSGQQVYARGSDLVLMSVVSFGAEVIADGNVHVYAPLRGRAIAGARGDRTARIFSTCMEPQLISIAGYYRTAEPPLAAEVLGKPAQARLEGEKLFVEPLKN